MSEHIAMQVSSSYLLLGIFYPPPSPFPPHLILRRTPQRELKPDPLPRQLPVHFRISIQPIIHTASLLLIQHHLQHLTPILSRPCPLSYNLHRVHDVAQDGVVDGCQSARVRALLGLRGARAVGTFGARKDAAGGEDEDMAVGELLFEFAG